MHPTPIDDPEIEMASDPAIAMPRLSARIEEDYLEAIPANGANHAH